MVLHSIIVAVPVILTHDLNDAKAHIVSQKQAETNLTLHKIMLHRQKRAIGTRSDRDTRPALKITCTKGITCSVKFDFCSVVACSSDRQQQWQWSEKYVCITAAECTTFQDMFWSTRNTYGCNCEMWNWVIVNTGKDDWGYDPQPTSSPDLKTRLTIIKGTASPNCQNNNCNPLILTLINPKSGDNGTYVISAYVQGTDPTGLISLQIVKPQPNVTQTAPITDSNVQYLTNLTFEDTLALEIGFDMDNKWLKWVQYTAQQHNRTNCIACAAARPHLGTVPFPLTPMTDPKGLQCILQLFKPSSTSTDQTCVTLSLRYPAVKTRDLPPTTVYAGQYTCFTRKATGLNVQHLNSTYCNDTIDITSDNGNFTADSFINQTTMRADVWWFCGDMKLRAKLPPQWKGSCALAKILMPFQLFQLDYLTELQKTILKHNGRNKHSTTLLKDSDNTVYLDSVGIPRGIPDEYKAQCEIVAGFESLIPQVGININVNWINYLYYNQPRFVNHTRDALRGISEPMAPTYLMAWENRIALDMLQAKEGGVCKMFGTTCCTFIPNNNFPDGSITKALQGLTVLSEELAENVGVDDPFSALMQKWFGCWSTLLTSLFAAMLVAVALLPCLRRLMMPSVDAEVTKTLYQQIPL